MKYDICIIGGCGHVGLPLGMAFADRGKKVALYDISTSTIDKVNNSIVPFKENGAEPVLKRVIKSGNLKATNDPKVIKDSKVVITVIGTPVDEHLNPRIHDIINAIKQVEGYLSDDQLLILRSTLYPGVTDKVYSYLHRKGKKTKVAFCPERIAEGHALTELYELPQIVAGCTDEAEKEAAELFRVLTTKVVTTKTAEAELAKLFTNTWRYINFAISNQFYMIAESQGLNFYRIYDAMTQDYPRLNSFAKAGLAAGPCLFKDTMQLSSFSGNNFFLGHSAMLVNEGFPDFIINQVKEKHDLEHLTVGLLGMAFKGDNDDPRESLSYKMKKKLEIEAKKVLCHDPYVKDSSLVDIDKVRDEADIIVIAAPHSVYNDEDWGDKIVIDMWNFYGKEGK